jgi:hypothetical protein
MTRVAECAISRMCGACSETLKACTVSSTAMSEADSSWLFSNLALAVLESLTAPIVGFQVITGEAKRPRSARLLDCPWTL